MDLMRVLIGCCPLETQTPIVYLSGDKMERLAQSLAPHFIPVCTDLFAKST